MKENEKEQADLEALEELIPLRKGGAMIGVPYETMRRYIKERKIPYYKVFGRIKVSKRELRALYNAWRIPALNVRLEGVIDAVRSEAQTHKR
jgi:hypothetical protein